MKSWVEHKVAELHAWAADFVRDTRGATAVFLAIGLFAFVGAVGLATDTVRGYLVKSRLHQALDAAGLAGGRVMFDADRDQQILDFFAANFPAGYLGSSVTTPTITPDVNNEKLTVTAHATIPTTLMRVLGIDHLDVSAVTEVTRRTEILDLVIAIDMSDSMNDPVSGGVNRIEAARAAATSLVNILFGADTVKPLLHIAVVPWNGKVNVTLEGTNFNPALNTSQVVPAFTNPRTGAVQTELWFANNSPVPFLSPPPADWKGCVYARFIDDGTDSTDGDIAYGAVSTPLGDWEGWEPIPGAEGEPQPGFFNNCTASPGFFAECTPCLSHGITTLNNDKQQVIQAINTLGNPTGHTNIPQGLAWAWRVLLPGEPFTDADPNPQGHRRQAIILLSDGENTGAYGDGYKAVFGTGGAATTPMDGRTVTLATNIKASGVKIYAIQFANSGTAMETLLKTVASSPNPPYYQYAPDATALAQVFSEVANDLSELRLSK